MYDLLTDGVEVFELTSPKITKDSTQTPHQPANAQPRAPRQAWQQTSPKHNVKSANPSPQKKMTISSWVLVDIVGNGL
jgi:hypothetical protein